MRLARQGLWVGPLVALSGVLSYFTLFYRWPALRDVPWLNFAIVALGIALSGAGWVRTGGRILGPISCVLATGFAALFVWYVYFLSYGLPPAGNALAVGARVPEVVVRDHRGDEVELSRAAQRPLVLVFFRGHW